MASRSYYHGHLHSDFEHDQHDGYLACRRAFIQRFRNRRAVPSVIGYLGLAHEHIRHSGASSLCTLYVVHWLSANIPHSRTNPVHHWRSHLYGVWVHSTAVRFLCHAPVSIGAAVLLIAYLQLFGAALQNLAGTTFNFRTIYRIALPVLIGLALQATSSQAFQTVNPLVRPLLSNGMIVGILLSILLENLLPWTKWASAADAGSPE